MIICRIFAFSIVILFAILFWVCSYSQFKFVFKPELENVSHTEDWNYIGTKKGVELYIKEVKGSKLLAFKGISIINMHISEIMGPFSNLSYAKEWVTMLRSIKKYDVPTTDRIGSNENHKHWSPISSLFSSIVNKHEHEIKPLKADEDIADGDEDLIHQIVDLPWPITPRDLLLRRKFSINEKNKSISINYHSVDDDRVPVHESIIRAISPYTKWKFQAVDDDGVEKEVGRVKNDKTITNCCDGFCLQENNKNKNAILNVVNTVCKNVIVKTTEPLKKVEKYFEVQLKRILSVSNYSIKKNKLKFVNTLFRATSKVFSTFKKNNSKIEKRIENINKKLIDLHDVEEKNFLEKNIKNVIGQNNEICNNINCELFCNCDDKKNKNNVCFKNKLMKKRKSEENVEKNKNKKTKKTRIEIESFVDSRGSIPSWFINFMQRFFLFFITNEYLVLI
jgi:hypothetical protein